MASDAAADRGQVAVITGATGFSRAAALEFGERGWNVAMISHRMDEVQKTLDMVKERSDVETLGESGEAGDESTMRQFMQHVQAKWGRLDAVFANAGVNGKWAPLEELDLSDFQDTVTANLASTFLTVRHAVPVMRHAGHGGAIIITSSINGTRVFSNPGTALYSMTKAAQVALMKTWACELGEEGIRINAVCPGAFDTEIWDNTEKVRTEDARFPIEFPHGKIPRTGHKPGHPSEVARLVAFLASSDASHISGSEMWIDGAESLTH